MKPMPENFVAFFTVCGFFIGLTFSIISIDGAFEMIVFTILITFLFYMLIHISVMFFIDTKKPVGRTFDVKEYETINDKLIGDLESREKRTEHIMAKLEEEREEMKKNEEKERRKNAKKRSA